MEPCEWVGDVLGRRGATRAAMVSAGSGVSSGLVATMLVAGSENSRIGSVLA